MSVLSSRPGSRWLVPAAAALAVIGGGVAIGAITAAADPRLTPRSAAELLVDLQTARLDGMSGTVVLRSDLGLPALPGVGGRGSADLTSLISGTHTLRVWYAGPEQVRVALLGTLGETDVIRNGRDLWIWESRENRATHRTLPADAGGDKAGAPGLPLLPSDLPFTPQQLADVALAALQPTTEVTTDGSARVAGRDAHELVLAPKDKASLVGSIRLAIDASEHVPLRVQVFARDSGDPALEIAFTQISFARPDPEQFRFNPPPGATVTEENADTGSKPGAADPGVKDPDAKDPDVKDPDAKDPGQGDQDKGRGVTVVGTGWTSVLVARLPESSPATGDPNAGGGADPGAGPDVDDAMRLLERLPKVSGAWGSGRMLTSRLVTVLVTDDGRILVGAVTPERITQVAADPAAKLTR
jgi:outer membrane lipoprotein-sorting protein